MTDNARQPGPREAVGIFMDADDLKRAGEELLKNGFDRTAMGILAGKEAVEKSLGDLYVRANAFSKHPDAPHMALVRRESMGATVHAWLGGLSLAGTTALGAVVVASSAVLGGAFIAAAAGAATIGSIGVLMRAIINETDAEHLQKQIDKGRLLLFATTHTSDEEGRATQILSKNNALEAKVYDVPVPSPGTGGSSQSAPQ